jgi:hypothetical protein
MKLKISKQQFVQFEMKGVPASSRRKMMSYITELRQLATRPEMLL